MAKTFKNIFPEIASFQNLFLASKKAQKGKRYRESTLIFNMDLEKNLFRLHGELLNKTYHHGPYHDFIVKDSKKRLISAAPYRDRVVHHAVINVIEPLFDKSFIPDSYACRKGKGTLAASRLLGRTRRGGSFITEERSVQGLSVIKGLLLSYGCYSSTIFSLINKGLPRQAVSRSGSVMLVGSVLTILPSPSTASLTLPLSSLA